MILYDESKFVYHFIMSFEFQGWSEDMDATQDQSLLVIGSRAGMKEEDVNSCLQVQNIIFVNCTVKLYSNVHVIRYC